jgi:hypothetical protein
MSGFHKMLQIRETALYKQIEGDKVTWLLDGIGKKRGMALLQYGCKWIRGKPGIWEVTEKIANYYIKRGVSVTEYRPEEQS